MNKQRTVVTTVLSIVVVGVLGLWFAHRPASGASEPVVPFNTDFADLRIENEAKLVVPNDQIEDVWTYLVERLVDDKTFIRSLDPDFDSYWYDELFTDVYFDTPDLVMLNHESGIRHRSRVNLTNPEHEKSGRELVQVKLNYINDNEQSRGELKFEVKRDRKPDEQDDLHPVLGLMSRSVRPSFKAVMAQLGVDPNQLDKVLTIKQRRRSIYITKHGSPFMSIRLDEVSSNMLWVRFRHCEIEPELNEIPYTLADAERRAEMEEVKDRIVADIEARFPAITLDLTPKYNKAFSYFEERIPRLRFLIKYDLML